MTNITLRELNDLLSKDTDPESLVEFLAKPIANYYCKTIWDKDVGDTYEKLFMMHLFKQADNTLDIELIYKEDNIEEYSINFTITVHDTYYEAGHSNNTYEVSILKVEHLNTDFEPEYIKVRSPYDDFRFTDYTHSYWSFVEPVTVTKVEYKDLV